VIKTKLVEFLRTFKTRDFRRFREYLASPFFNKREDLCAFYAVLLDAAPQFSGTLIKREKVWRRYAGDQPFSEKEFNYLTNFLLQHAENYIAMESFGEDQTSKHSRVLGYCLDKGLHKHYKGVYQRAQKSLTAEPYRDGDWHLKAWRLADAEMHRFYSFHSRRADSSITAVVDHLDAFYLDKKLALSSEILNINQILNEKFDTSFTQELVMLMANRESSRSIIEIRKLILNLLRDPEDVSSFFRLRDLLPLAQEHYPPDKAKGVFTYAQNYCIRRIKSGDATFEVELFRIYQETIRSEIIFEDGMLSPWHCKNICSIALKLREFSWVGEFLAGHEHRIPLEFRSTAIAYNQANLLFHQERFGEALRSLSKVEFADVFYALDTRKMMLMIYFIRKDSEAFFSLVSSFKTYLNRNQVISEPSRIAYKSFVEWIAKIFRLPEWEFREKKTLLKEELSQAQQIVGKEWLVKQLS